MLLINFFNLFFSNRLYFKFRHTYEEKRKPIKSAGIKLIHCNAATRLMALELCNQYKPGRYMVVGCFSRIRMFNLLISNS